MALVAKNKQPMGAKGLKRNTICEKASWPQTPSSA
jgi:hypothetical protein